MKKTAADNSKKYWLLAGALILVVGLILCGIYQADIKDDGQVYSNKTTLCRHMAQSYLKTIRKTESISDYGSEVWKMAIDIESDMYNLCLLDLNTDSLRGYKLNNLSKYQR